MQRTALDIEVRGPVALLNASWTTQLFDQLDHDSVSGVLDRWGNSTIVDELTRERILREDVAAVLARRSGTAIQGPVMHAGILHTYGYLLSAAWTAYGWKRDRWTGAGVAAALGLDPRTLTADPPEGTLLGNLTAVLDSLVGTAVHPVLRPADFRISRLTETPYGYGGQTVLRTYFVSAAEPRESQRMLLVYTVQDDEPEEVLVTAFPITPDYRDSLLTGCGEEKPIIARFNAATDVGGPVLGHRVHTLLESH